MDALFNPLIQIVSLGFITLGLCSHLKHRLLKYKLKQCKCLIIESQALIQQLIKEDILFHVKQAAEWRISIRAALFCSTAAADAAAAYSLSQL